MWTFVGVYEIFEEWSWLTFCKTNVDNIKPI